MGYSLTNDNNDLPDEIPDDRRVDDGPESDIFKPPEVPVMCRCLHCGREYMSDQIRWRPDEDGAANSGFWVCPYNEECGGAGFCFDIYPLDSDMWKEDDDEESDTGDEFGEEDLLGDLDDLGGSGELSDLDLTDLEDLNELDEENPPF